ncbi:hypothetical protein TPL01_28850 [Sulfuriferula plumbiphila]|uniref:UPF0033 domain-containing protein n=1 Tax=Sulfuriferula plumbiphila TaxID=171865 RepID=A0A512LB95_9PROT|nr:hypothetical protein SFPGR_18670 [Sulfuriferula plumbiphila]GEP31747.1 hypothetical protein TPL01_28850 [Sulfuriferula plumbiphila]
MKYQHTLDICNTTGPWTILNCKKELEAMNSGEILKVILHTESKDLTVIETFCKQVGHEVIGHDVEGDGQVCYIKRKKS